MKKIQLMFICLSTVLMFFSCKKDSNSFNNPSGKTNTTGATTLTYNITYKIWNPNKSISTPEHSGVPPTYIPNGTDSIIVFLDSTNTNHTVALVVSSIYNSSECSPSSGCLYDVVVNIYSRSSDVYIATNAQGLVNDAINRTLSWSTGISLTGGLAHWGCYGYWGCGLANNAPGYIGIKIASSSGNKYGWIEVSASSNSITMIAQALNNNYEQPIQAGQTN